MVYTTRWSVPHGIITHVCPMVWPFSIIRNNDLHCWYSSIGIYPWFGQTVSKRFSVQGTGLSFWSVFHSCWLSSMFNSVERSSPLRIEKDFMYQTTFWGKTILSLWKHILCAVHFNWIYILLEDIGFHVFPLGRLHTWNRANIIVLNN